MSELQAIKERMDTVTHLEWITGDIRVEDVYWLIEQAEKVEQFRKKALWFEKTLKEILQKTKNDPKLYPHWDKEELILEYHLVAKEALNKFNL